MLRLRVEYDWYLFLLEVSSSKQEYHSTFELSSTYIYKILRWNQYDIKYQVKYYVISIKYKFFLIYFYMLIQRFIVVELKIVCIWQNIIIIYTYYIWWAYTIHLLIHTYFRVLYPHILFFISLIFALHLHVKLFMFWNRHLKKDYNDYVNDLNQIYSFS